MKPLAWSCTATGFAAVVFATVGQGTTDVGMRWLGAAGGVVLAVAATAWHVKRTPRPRVAAPQPTRVVPRFFIERRGAPRHETDIPVRLSVNGHRYDATLLCVSARGALLRLPTTPGEPLHAQVGQPVQIEDYPPGRLARIGANGVYVDFALAFDAPQPNGEPAAVPQLVEADRTRRL